MNQVADSGVIASATRRRRAFAWAVGLIAVSALLGAVVLLQGRRTVRLDLRNWLDDEVTAVELCYLGGEEHWGQLAPGSRAEASLPRSALASAHVSFTTADGRNHRVPLILAVKDPHRRRLRIAITANYRFDRGWRYSLWQPPPSPWISDLLWGD
jgi:hypothetical protein